jgi:hypothetical protein
MSLEGKGLGLTILPKYFYDLDAITDEGRPRWVDEYADPAPHVIQPGDLNPFRLRAKAARNEWYAKWAAAFCAKTPDGNYVPKLKPGIFTWQAIRVLRATHSETNRHKDWWPNYQDCLFRVFIQPQTLYCDRTGEHKQWYLLAPEDSYLVNRYEKEQKAGPQRPREYAGRERYLSADPDLRKARVIPVECCHHLRNEGQEYTHAL